MAWDGYYRINMFHKAPQSNGIVRIPTNLQELLDQEDTVYEEDPGYISTMRSPSSTSESPNVTANNSILELFEGIAEHEEPFSDDDLDPMIDNYAEDELWNNTEWRKRLERKLQKKIKETEVRNSFTFKIP